MYEQHETPEAQGVAWETPPEETPVEEAGAVVRGARGDLDAPAAPSVPDALRPAQDQIGSAVQASGGAIQAVQQTAGHAVQAAQQAAGDTLEAARQQAQGAKEVVRQQAAESMAQASEGIAGAAAAVGQMSDTLRTVDHGAVSQYTDKAAQQLEALAARLRGMTPEQALHEIEQLARRQPALFMAGAFAVGLLGARILHGGEQKQQEKK